MVGVRVRIGVRVHFSTLEWPLSGERGPSSGPLPPPIWKSGQWWRLKRASTAALPAYRFICASAPAVALIAEQSEWGHASGYCSGAATKRPLRWSVCGPELPPTWFGFGLGLGLVSVLGLGLGLGSSLGLGAWA